MKRLSLPAHYYLIVLLPVAVFVASEGMIEALSNPSIDIRPISHLEPNGVDEAVGRYRFIAFISLFLMIAILSISYCLHDLLSILSRRTLLIATVAALPILFIVSILIIKDDSESTKTYYYVGKELFEAAMSKTPVFECDQNSLARTLDCNNLGFLTTYRRVLDFLNVFTALSVSAVVVGMVSCLAGICDPDLDQFRKRAVLATVHAKKSEKYLYLASALLMSGVLLIRAWMLWPIWAVSVAQRESYEALVDALVLCFGVLYSAVILSFYVPVYLILARKFDEIAREHLGEGDYWIPERRETWLTENGLLLSVSTSLKSIIAVAAPLATGALSSVISSLSSS